MSSPMKWSSNGQSERRHQWRALRAYIEIGKCLERRASDEGGALSRREYRPQVSLNRQRITAASKCQNPRLLVRMAAL